MAITLRASGPADEPMLRAIYESTRVEEMAMVPWTGDQKVAFLLQQHAAQHRHYREQYPDARFDLILESDAPIGRLYVNRSPGQIHIIDIALLPSHRSRGIATSLLGDLAAEADATRAVMTIHVEKHNPALRLYQRIGFTVAADKGVYWYLERVADPT